MLLTIIGGGPVGLITAAIFKKTFPKLNIQIIEKRGTKTRDQIVYFKPYTLKRSLPETIIDQLLKEGKGCYMLPPDRNQGGYCYKEAAVEGHYSLAIKISLLEEVLTKYVKQLKVKIVTKEESCKAKIKGDLIIGADGIHSCVRTALLKTEFKKFEEYESYGLAITYKDDSSPKYIIGVNSEIRDKINLSKIDQHRKRFFRTDDSESYLGLQISRSDYESLLDVTEFKSAPTHIKELIKSYLTHIGSDTKQLTKAKLSTFPVDVKHAVKYATLTKEGQPVFLVGDAAISSHFFTAFGINVGFEQARLLLRLVHKYDFKEWSEIIRQYTQQMELFATDALNEAINVYLPIEQIDNICASLTKKELKRAAEQEGVDIKGISKQESCYLLSRHLLINYSHMFFRN